MSTSTPALKSGCRTQNRSQRSYFHASVRQVAKPLLRFEYLFHQDSPEDKITAQLQLFSYNDQSADFMPADALADVVQRTRVRGKAECADSANSAQANNITSRPLVELIVPGETVSVAPAEMQGLRFCYKILLDPDGDGDDWYTYHYTAPKIPHYYLDKGLPQELDMQGLLELFKRHLTAKGLEVLENINFKIDENGCIGAQPDDHIGGCWARKTSTLYINDDYFPEDYGDLAYIGKVIALQKALSVLTHEFFHAADSYVAETGTERLVATMLDCHSTDHMDYYKRLPGRHGDLPARRSEMGHNHRDPQGSL